MCQRADLDTSIVCSVTRTTVRCVIELTQIQACVMLCVLSPGRLGGAPGPAGHPDPRARGGPGSSPEPPGTPRHNGRGPGELRA